MDREFNYIFLSKLGLFGSGRGSNGRGAPVGFLWAEFQLKRSHGDPFRNQNHVFVWPVFLGTDHLALTNYYWAVTSDYLVLTIDYLVVTIDHSVVTSDYVVLTSHYLVEASDYLVMASEYLVVTNDFLVLTCDGLVGTNPR